MAAVELILLQRVENLGQMGDVVKVKPGYARNYLLPQKKALRANKSNMDHFAQQRAQLEANNLKRREEAERLAERVIGMIVVIIRQAGESGSLYGSVSNRDIADACTEHGVTVNRSQVILEHPIKTVGLHKVRVALHPEVSITISQHRPQSRRIGPPGSRRERRRRGRRRVPDAYGRGHLRRRYPPAGVAPLHRRRQQLRRSVAGRKPATDRFHRLRQITCGASHGGVPVFA